MLPNINALTLDSHPELFQAFAAVPNLRRKVVEARKPYALANWLQTKLRRSGFRCKMKYEAKPLDGSGPKIVLVDIAEGTPEQWRHFGRRHDFDVQSPRRLAAKKPGFQVEVSRRRPLIMAAAG